MPLAASWPGGAAFDREDRVVVLSKLPEGLDDRRLHGVVDHGLGREFLAFAEDLADVRDGEADEHADDGDGDEECAQRDGQVFDIDEAESIEDHPNGTLDWIPLTN